MTSIERLKTKLHDTNKIKELEPLINDFESILSNDFDKMNLAELNHVQKEFCKIAGMHDGRETITPTESQTKARDYLWFRITEEEHKTERVKLGDLFKSSWGYDQTNVEFFKVVEISPSGKTCKVIEINMKSVKGSAGFMSDSVTPDTEAVKNNGKKYRVKITRSLSFHPYKNKHLEIGEIMLRGSIPYAQDYTHLQTLRKIEKNGSTYRSWYA